MNTTKVTRILLLGLVIVSLSGCLNFLRYHGTCRHPQEVTPESLVGTWQTQYDEYNKMPRVYPLVGTETLTINYDGTYSQRYRSNEYNYASPKYSWELVLDEGDGPKLKMENLVYHANGPENSDASLTLYQQTIDRLNYKQKYPDISDRTATTLVHYPDDGFVYLYPRYCFDTFALLQMDSVPNDPDAIMVEHAVFTRVP